MKNSIKVSALFLLLGAGIFAATPSKAADKIVAAKADQITFSSLRSSNGVGVAVEKNAPGKAIVTIYDQDRNVLRKDVVKNKDFQKGYIFDQLEDGNYNIEVVSNNQVAKKDIHVYEQDGVKTFFFFAE